MARHSPSTGMCGPAEGLAVSAGSLRAMAAPGGAAKPHGRVLTGYFVISQAGRFCPRSSPPRWDGTGGCPGCAASAWRARHFPARPTATLAACSISLAFRSRGRRGRGAAAEVFGAPCDSSHGAQHCALPCFTRLAPPPRLVSGRVHGRLHLYNTMPGQCAAAHGHTRASMRVAQTATPATQEPHHALSPAGRTWPPAACTLLQWGLWGVGASWAPAL